MFEHIHKVVVVIIAVNVLVDHGYYRAISVHIPVRNRLNVISVTRHLPIKGIYLDNEE